MKVRLEDLSKSYEDADRALKVIDSLSFEFPECGKVAVVGRSGVGKSTLLHLLAGLDKPNNGAVYLGDTNITSLSEEELSCFRGENIGFVFQFHYLLPEFDACENVAMPLLIAGVDEKEAQERAKSILVKLGLSERLHHRPGQLSGGEQQRVAIARAVISKPRIILADEPTGNLDYETASDIQDLLIELQQELHNILIVVTHQPEMADRMDFKLEMLPGGGLKEISREL